MPRRNKKQTSVHPGGRGTKGDEWGWTDTWMAGVWGWEQLKDKEWRDGRWQAISK